MLKDSAIPILILAAGIALMVYSIYIAKKLLCNIERKELKGKCKLIFGLICFFLAGYIAYLYFLAAKEPLFQLTEILVSAVFCLGALFVVVVLSINIKLIQGLHEANEDLSNANTKLSAANTDLRKVANKLRSNNAQVTKAKKEVENKNIILTSALEELYKSRTRKQKGTEQLKKDSEKTRRKIEKLKGYLTK